MRVSPGYSLPGRHPPAADCAAVPPRARGDPPVGGWAYVCKRMHLHVWAAVYMQAVRPMCLYEIESTYYKLHK